jgi:hypothetical protein
MQPRVRSVQSCWPAAGASSAVHGAHPEVSSQGARSVRQFLRIRAICPAALEHGANSPKKAEELPDAPSPSLHAVAALGRRRWPAGVAYAGAAHQLEPRPAPLRAGSRLAALISAPAPDH